MHELTEGLMAGKLYNVTGIWICGDDTRIPRTYRDVMYTGPEDTMHSNWHVFLSDRDFDGRDDFLRVRFPFGRYQIAGSEVVTDEILTPVSIFLDPEEHSPNTVRFLYKAMALAEGLPDGEKRGRLLSMIVLSLSKEYQDRGVTVRVERIDPDLVEEAFADYL